MIPRTAVFRVVAVGGLDTLTPDQACVLVKIEADHPQWAKAERRVINVESLDARVDSGVYVARSPAGVAAGSLVAVRTRWSAGGKFISSSGETASLHAVDRFVGADE